VGTVDFAGSEEVDEAVAAAAAGFDQWRRSSIAARVEVLSGFRDQLGRHESEVVDAISREHGKVRGDAAGEVARAAEVVDFACGIGHLLKGEFSQAVSSNVDVHSLRQPLGAVVGITPFNFPAMVPLWMAPLAIACGNAFVLKPSERDPSASIVLAELWQGAGLPDGVFSVVQGDAATVQCLLEHPDVRAVSFVGSTPVARHIYATAAEHAKRVQALGGAKNHMVVMPDADVDAAADAAVNAGFGSTGERCMAISAVVAVGAVGDGLVERIRDRAEALIVGPASDAASEMGPLISEAHRDRLFGYLERAQDRGVDLVLDGRDHPRARQVGGYWLGPTVVDHLDAADELYRDELFGPVLCVLRVPDYAAALELVNASPWGNGAAIFTDSGNAARRFTLDVEAGMVGVNVPIPVPVAPYSFGGWKSSLFGDLHAYGADAIRFYTRGKVVTSRWQSRRAGIDLGFPTSD
jgi:malonate-semialdehyde dehydrogenase (acetylating)/methylmalonate-semialdehyde dehydrogenase